MSLKLCAVALRIVAFIIILTICKIIVRALYSPLRKVPGPFYSHFTGLPSIIATLSRNQVDYHHQLHKKYGAFVRTSPNEVFVSDLQSYKAIHRIGSGFNKSDFYHFFGPTEAGVPPYGLFQMTDPDTHTARRKLLGRDFTQNSLRQTWEPIICEKVAAAIEGMNSELQTSLGEVDIRKWWMLMASDVVSQLMFGRSFDSIKAGKQDEWFEAVKIAAQASATAMFFPNFYHLAKRVPLVRNLRFFNAHKELFAKGRIAVENSNGNITNQNLFAKVSSESQKGELALTEEEICVEAGSFMVAGSDTTSNTLTYLIWATLSSPYLQQQLEQELSAIETHFNDANLEGLPILNAVVQETLRLYGAAPGPLPRVVPSEGVTFGKLYLPGGTTVCTQSWTMHRDPMIYEDPERFDHTRWLPGGSCSTSADARAAFTPFGAGSRVCIGKYLALMELRYGAAMFFRKLKGARIAPSTTPESMRMEHLVLVEPVGKVCKIYLDPKTIKGT